ncbi:MAG: HEAT repeat domain-containing protein [Planctomycetota bacterium]
MPTLAHRLKLLEGEPLRAAAAFLAAALPHAEPDEREAIYVAALHTGRPDALAAVIGLLHRLGPGGMAQVCDVPGSLEPAVRLIRRRGSPRAVLNAVAVARRRCDLDLFGHLVALLSAPDDQVQRRAGEALVTIVVDRAGPDGRRLLDPTTARRLDEAVAGAVIPDRDRRLDEVLLAAAVLANRPGPALRRILDDPDHPVLFALRGVVARTGRRLVRSNMLRWITDPVLGGPARRSMHRIRGPQQLADLLGAGHLLLSPRRRRAMRRVDRPGRLAPGPAGAAALPPPAQVGLVHMIRALPLPAAARRDHLADCIALSSPVARLRALEALLGDPSAAAQDLIERFCFDRARPVAVLASGRALRGAESLGPVGLGRLQQSPHRIVARRAEIIAARSSTKAFFDRWMSLGRNDWWAAGLALLRTQREAFLARLTNLMATGERDERLAAITLARRLGVTAALEAELIRQVGSVDFRVASAAVAALGDGGSGQCSAAVRRALGHADPRVRANAVEALVRIDRRPGAHLDALAASRDNRLRANAVRGLLVGRSSGGVKALRRMLTDDDPRHRVSAVWVARRSRARSVVGDLRRLADSDLFSEIRGRAAAAVRLLDHQVLAVGSAGGTTS